MYNAVSGETVAYTYDSLNRMITANGSGWGEAYTFDPFGNLTTKHVTSGTGPSFPSRQPPNNQVTSVYGQGYDANGNTKDGNMTAYDAENHLIGAGWNNGAPAVDYAYDAQGKRSFLWTAGTFDTWGGNATNYSVVMYSPSGQKLGTYLISVCNQGANNTTSLTICSALSNQRQILRRPPPGGDGPARLGRHLLSVGRSEGVHQPARRLELRHLLARFGQRVGLREPTILFEYLRTVHDPGPVQGKRWSGRSTKLEPLRLYPRRSSEPSGS